MVKALDAACLNANGSEDDEAAAGSAAVHSSGILGKARDWNLYADLAGRRKHPCVVKETGARPDLIIMPESYKILVVVELTVPCVTNISESHEYKVAKYEELMESLQGGGFVTHYFAVEVGARASLERLCIVCLSG